VLTPFFYPPHQALLRAGYRPISGSADSKDDKSEPEPALVEMLQRKGGGVLSKNRDGSIVLHVAACENNVAVAAMCVGVHAERGDGHREGIDSPSDDSEMTPLMLCSRHGSVGVAKLLVEGGADLNCRDKDGNTALHHTWWETGGNAI